MSGKSDQSGSGDLVRTAAAVVIAVVAAVVALKVTLWALKSLLIVAVVGAVGFGVYSLVSGRLRAGDDVDKPRGLLESDPSSESDAPSETDTGDDPLAETDSVLKELEELKRRRGE